MSNTLEGFVVIRSKRACHRRINGRVGEIFGYAVCQNGTVRYGVSLNGKDYEFYGHELEVVKE